jgi:cation:H+ antiporter
MLSNLLLLVGGFALLIKGAGYLVDGASSIARRLGVSSLVVGLTVVAFGTSAPELVVNIFASIRGVGDIAIGNVFGSNISNIFLVLGIAAMVRPLTANRGTIWKEIPLGILAVIIVGVMANDALIDGRLFSELSRIDGLILIAFFAIFIYYVFGIGKVRAVDQFNTPVEIYPIWKSVTMTAIGILGLALGGHWIITSATVLARGLHISEAVIGLSIVALGTSLPELATSAIAAYKKDVDIAIGNVVGSNIFNIFWVLGLSAVIRPLSFSGELLIDVVVALVAAVGLFAVMMFGRKRRTLEKWEGAVFVLIYVFYIISLSFR